LQYPSVLQFDHIVPLLNNDIIKNIGYRYGKTNAQILLRWGIQKGLSVIPKSTTQSRIRENKKIFDFVLDEDSMSKIDALNCNLRFVNPTWFKFSE